MSEQRDLCPSAKKIARQYVCTKCGDSEPCSLSFVTRADKMIEEPDTCHWGVFSPEWQPFTEMDAEDIVLPED
jgi:hypothetical protein